MNETILKIKGESAVQAHVSMLQGIINRMASNSAGCKSWCLSISAGVFAIGFVHGNSISNVDFLYVIVLLFYFLDCFYLGLERKYITEMAEYITAINNEDSDFDIAKRTFVVGDGKKYSCGFEKKLVSFFSQVINTGKAIFSFSTTPFYGVLLLCVNWLS